MSVCCPQRFRINIWLNTGILLSENISTRAIYDMSGNVPAMGRRVQLPDIAQLDILWFAFMRRLED